jgi:uncharacterized repeat protein (TIGR03803 family)
LIANTDGHLYGTTRGGGSYAYGTVFELTPASHGWSEKVLYSFGTNRHDGGEPYAGLVMDEADNLYGAAARGGGLNLGGTVFELTPATGGWEEKVLHEFPQHHGDGGAAFAGVILDASENLYGTTEGGGSDRKCPTNGCGIAYELHRMPDGKWKETVLHEFGSFDGDGIFPGVGALTMDPWGSLYGTTDVGGASGHGTVFRLTRLANGHWTEAILYNLTGGAKGDGPSAGVVVDKAGNLYGTTIAGGTASCDCGVVYKLAPGSNGKWKYTVLHTFTGYDGAQPDANLILDKKGNLYGTTAIGGAGGAGVAFELTP